jgi:predicted dinucleotide-binding enzyme
LTICGGGSAAARSCDICLLAVRQTVQPSLAASFYVQQNKYLPVVDVTSAIIGSRSPSVTGPLV